jgi:hypothetical protein
MTEAEWLESTNPYRMMEHLRGRASERKLRLFACACCRRLWPIIGNEHCRTAVEVSERYADGMATAKELKTARDLAIRSHQGPEPVEEPVGPPLTRPFVTQRPLSPEERASLAERAAIFCACSGLSMGWSGLKPGQWPLAEEARAAAVRAAEDTGLERRYQCQLIREIFGNPFRALAMPTYWPAAVVALAAAWDTGQDCGFALHDALLDGGLTEMAEHFRDPQRGHPKGCWVVDLILGKK